MDGRRWVGLRIAAVVAASVPAASGDAAAQARPAADRGQDLAERLCAGCHAVGPAGASPQAAAPPFRTFPDRWPVEYLAEALAEGIVVGHGADVAMPEFRFEPAEIDALIAYLDALGGAAGPSGR